MQTANWYRPCPFICVTPFKKINWKKFLCLYELYEFISLKETEKNFSKQINSQNKICHLYVVVESLIDRYYLNKMRRSFLIWKRKPGYVGEDCSGGSSDEGTAFVYPLHQTIDYFLPATNNPLLSLIFFVFVCPLQIRLDFSPE